MVARKLKGAVFGCIKNGMQRGLTSSGKLAIQTLVGGGLGGLTGGGVVCHLGGWGVVCWGGGLGWGGGVGGVVLDGVEGSGVFCVYFSCRGEKRLTR